MRTAIIFLLCVLLCGCINRIEPPKKPLCEKHYIYNAEREAVQSEAFSGNSDAAYRLALHEVYFGSASRALYWFNLACEKGYERESCPYLPLFKQLECNLEESMPR